MKIGVIVANSNSAKNELLYNTVCKAAKKDDEVLNFGWCGELNLQNTMNALFDGDFGSGYPEKDAERKRHDTVLLKEIKNLSSVSFEELLGKLDKKMVEKAEKIITRR